MALSEKRAELLGTLLEVGRLAFEAGLYFNAVVHWEQAWREELGPERRLLQGLMQAAGAYHKLELGQATGTLKLLALAIEQLGPLPDGFGGLRLGPFRAGLLRSRREVVAWAVGGSHPRPAPSLARAA